MARRRVGTAGARALASAPSLAAAVSLLATSPYGRLVRTESTMAGAQRAVAATLLWNLRVLAGWLPATGAEQLRRLAGWFELSNVDEQVAAVSGQPAEPPYRLGALATAWPRLAATASLDDLRAALTASPWGDPGGATPRHIQLGMRLSWAARVAARVPPARAWATGAAALLVARERFARREELPERATAIAIGLLGHRWRTADTPAALAATLPAQARWVLAAVTDPADLWTAEVAWWRRLRADGARLLGASGPGPVAMVGAAALLAVDAWSVRAALAVAGRQPPDPGVFDALA
jgi:hypothetical protein